MYKFSVIIPFRNRHEHISVLVPHLRNYAKTHNLDFEIIVAEQDDNEPLRRGALRNEGVRMSTGDIIVLHDVDYLPDTTVKYWTEDTDVFRAVKRVEFITMDGQPRPENDIPGGYRKFNKSIDDNFYGGVLCIKKDQFLRINGYNPLFEGWGLEDDDFRERIRRNGLSVQSGDGLFRALPHPDSFRNDELFRKNQYLFQNRESLSSIGMNCGTLVSHINKEKAEKFDVDIWLEVTKWNIPQPTQTSISNISKLDYGIFATIENVQTDHIQRAVANGNRWEPEVMALCERYVKPGSVAIDIGANMGTFTVRLSQLVGVDGVVIAFEPQRIIYQQLCCNLFLNKRKNVFAYNIALGKERSEVTLTPINYNNGAPGEVRIHGQSGERVMCESLDSFQLNNVSLIKMDVERYEPFVFDGAKETIKRNRPIIVFELTTLPLPDYPTDFIINLLAEMNYNVYEVTEWGDYLGVPQEKDDIRN